MFNSIQNANHQIQVIFDAPCEPYHQQTQSYGVIMQASQNAVIQAQIQAQAQSQSQSQIAILRRQIMSENFNLPSPNDAFNLNNASAALTSSPSSSSSSSSPSSASSNSATSSFSASNDTAHPYFAGGTCTVTGDPYVKTFGGITFPFMFHGAYHLVMSDFINIQAYFFPCAILGEKQGLVNATCTGAVGIRLGIYHF